MAIKMVREPSETPNINNIDDIVPMRYAYGNQNGYVIGKGNEISNTVNGLNFTVNSGRLVLQGVECDIDAVGVTITIDNIATTRYYVVYLQVNLGTNTASILSTYDTVTYPTIDAGDDLTENTTGVARLPLYQFTATSGIIGEVNKVVEKVVYTNQLFNDFQTKIIDGTIIAKESKNSDIAQKLRSKYEQEKYIELNVDEYGFFDLYSGSSKYRIAPNNLIIDSVDNPIQINSSEKELLDTSMIYPCNTFLVLFSKSRNDEFKNSYEVVPFIVSKVSELGTFVSIYNAGNDKINFKVSKLDETGRISIKVYKTHSSGIEYTFKIFRMQMLS